MTLADAQKQLEVASLPKDLKDTIKESLERLSHLQESREYYAEYDSLLRYVEWVVHLPWSPMTKDNLDIKAAKSILDSHHFGLEQVKERIIEYIAVRKLQERSSGGSFHAPILCFTGLQGSGKTTLARSIAEALGRKFERVSLGAIGNTGQLRGQPRFGDDSEPGQVIKALRRAGTRNPVILLDEVDKVSGDLSLRSDVMAALLEILDPEQNATFRDHYIDYPFDLAQVIFVCTANDLVTVAPAVLDRLEIIQMPSYSDEEKITIGKDYLLPKYTLLNGLEKGEIAIADSLWPKIVRPLGYDAGVRTLERNLDAITRRVAKKIVSGEGPAFTITENNIKDFLESY